MEFDLEKILAHASIIIIGFIASSWCFSMLCTLREIRDILKRHTFVTFTKEKEQ